MKSEKNKTVSKEERFIQLGYRLLESKFTYYHPALVHKDWKHLSITDAEYDALENEYKALAEELGKNAYTCNLVDFPDTPSARMVAIRLSNPKD